jgi:hypothetical protein
VAANLLENGERRVSDELDAGVPRERLIYSEVRRGSFI